MFPVFLIVLFQKERHSGLTSALGPSGSLQQAISFFTGTLPFTIWLTISRPRPLLAPVISTFTDCAVISSASSCCSLLGLNIMFSLVYPHPHSHVSLALVPFFFFFFTHLCFEHILIMWCLGWLNANALETITIPQAALCTTILHLLLIHVKNWFLENTQKTFYSRKSPDSK